MAATAFEVAESPRNVTLDGSSPSVEAEYCVLDAADETEAKEAVEAIAPATFQAVSQSLEREPVRLSHQGGNVWKATVRYVKGTATSSDPQVGQPTTYTLEFDTSGETIKKGGVKPANQRKFSWSDGSDPAPNIKGLLGWDGKNKSNGADVVAPGLKMTLTANYHSSFVDSVQIKNWSIGTGKVNSDVFLGFAAGELLCLGVKGKVTIDSLTLRGIDPVPVSFSFQASENIYGPITIGQISITGGKEGWELVEVISGEADDTDTTPPQKVVKPLYAYVSKIYDKTSFAIMTGIFR